MKWKKLLSLVLTLVMVLTVLPPLPARADGANSVTVIAGGESTYDPTVHGKVQINDRTPTAESDTIYVDSGTQVTITAIPDEGYRLAYWLGPAGWYYGNPGKTTLTFSVSSNVTYSAYFISTSKNASAEIADIDLGYASVGYQAVAGSAAYPTYQIKGNVTLKNTGECLLVPYGFQLDEESSQYFKLARTYAGTAMSPVTPGSSQSWYYIVYPKDGLDVGIYEGTITFVERCQPGLAAPVTAKVTFEVTDDPVITTKVSPSDSGTVEGGGRYEKGNTVTLTATPNEHYRFVKWSDGVTESTENPYIFTATEAATVTAYFEQYEYKVLVTARGENDYIHEVHGKVQINDRTPTAGTDSAYFEKGSEVTITAIPDEGYRLAYWIGPAGWYYGSPGKTTITSSVSSDVSFSAYFISTSKTASAEMADIDLGTYSEGYTAVSWAGTYATYHISAPLSVHNTGECTLYPYSFTLDEEGSQYFRIGRTYKSASTSISPGQTTSNYYIVYPKEGLSAGTYTATVTMVEYCQPGLAAPLTANVTFTVTPKYIITAEVSPEGAGTVEGAGEYEAGASVTLTATASDTFAFDHWERGAETSTDNPYTFTAEKTETAKAVFRRTSYKVSISADPAEGGTVSAVASDGTEFGLSGSVLSANLKKETTVTVTATPNTGYRFKHWTDNGKQAGNDASITVEAILDHTLVACFEKLEEGVVPESVSLSYNGANQTAYTDTAIYTVKSGGSGKAAGNYTAVLSLKDGAIWSDMTTGDKSVSWKITPAPVAATVAAADRAYEPGNKEVALTAKELSGVFGGDTVTIDLSAAKGTMEDEGAGSAKAVTVTGVKLGGADAANYTLTAQPTGVTVNIAKAAQSGFKLPETAVTRTYGDPDFSLTATGTGAGSTVTYDSSDTGVVTVDDTGNVHITGVGTAVITASAAETANYIAAEASCTVAVGLKYALVAAIESGTAHCTVEAKEAKAGVWIVAAAYDAAGRLIDVKIGTADLKVGTNKVDISDLKESTSYRVFLLDGGDAKPLSDMWKSE